MTKSTKSHIRERSPLLYISSRVHELVARAMRGECVRQRIKCKSAVLRSPLSHTTTRANIAHEKTEQIRARIVCTPAEKRGAGVNLVCVLTKARIFASLLQWEKVARFTATDEVLLYVYCQNKPYLYYIRTQLPPPPPNSPPTACAQLILVKITNERKIYHHILDKI